MILHVWWGNLWGFVWHHEQQRQWTTEDFRDHGHLHDRDWQCHYRDHDQRRRCLDHDQ
jgi:hypothetical protein